MSIFDLFWLFIIIVSLTPMLQQRLLAMARIRLMQRIERQRQSRLITLIHRQESIAFLGIPLTRFIDIDDSEQLLRAIRFTPPDMPIDLIVHTPGGLVLAAEQIAHALMRHPAKVTVFVPHYAMSGGTLIALAADEIIMDENAVLGPVDPQLGEYPAVSLLEVLAKKPIKEIEDKTLILADVARKAMTQVHQAVKEILISNNMPEEKANEVAQTLSSGKWTHDYPITLEEARALGLPVNNGLPKEVYDLMDLYPQPAQRRPSVQYIPVPYHREPIPPRPPR
ncbi:MAG: ATP-dependent Clp protease proteolytic subunit [Chloroflexi bacterium]|nr:ATP-dependent Clp protease proteolytic subunit [Chloroflexota bacterium]